MNPIDLKSISPEDLLEEVIAGENITAGYTIKDIYDANGADNPGSGIRLIKASYYTHDTTCGMVDLKRTSDDGAGGELISIFVNNPILYNELRILIQRADGPILIFADWDRTGNRMTGIIESRNQIATEN